MEADRLALGSPRWPEGLVVRRRLAISASPASARIPPEHPSEPGPAGRGEDALPETRPAARLLDPAERVRPGAVDRPSRDDRRPFRGAGRGELPDSRRASASGPPPTSRQPSRRSETTATSVRAPSCSARSRSDPGTVIGANAVVNRSFPEGNVTLVGMPGRGDQRRWRGQRETSSSTPRARRRCCSPRCARRRVARRTRCSCSRARCARRGHAVGIVAFGDAGQPARSASTAWT